MKKIKSKIGFVLAGLYFLGTIAIVIYAFACSGIYCGMMIVLPVMPWVFLLEGIVNDSIFVFLFIVILNTILIYYFGYLLTKVIKKIKK